MTKRRIVGRRSLNNSFENKSQELLRTALALHCTASHLKKVVVRGTAPSNIPTSVS